MRIRLAGLLFFGLCFCLPVVSLEPLPPETDARFQAGAHVVIGCEGCHWDDPDRIPRSKLTTVCGDCHPGPYQDYETSVHWDDGKAHSVCTDCHGLHGILPVRNTQSKAHRSRVCGTCHPGPMEELNRGPHGEAFDQTGTTVCASCHNNHAIQRPILARIEAACESCHSRNSEAFRFGQQVSGKFEGLEDQLSKVHAKVRVAEAEGYATETTDRMVSAAGGQVRQAKLVWHSLDGDRIDKPAAQASVLIDSVFRHIQEQAETQRRRETGIVVVWIVILLAITALHLKRKSLENEN